MIKSLIGQGSGSGKLYYDSLTVLGPVVGATTCTLAPTREVTNGYIGIIAI